MNRLKKASRLFAALLMIVMITGCSSVKFEPTVSSIYVDKDGTVFGADIESFDNSSFTEERYKEEDLKAFVEDEVKAYNQEKAGISEAYEPEEKEKNDDSEPLPVSISSLTVEENTAKLILKYANCDDYLAFTKADDTVTGILFANAAQASEADLFPADLVDAKGQAVDTAKYAGSDKAFVVSVIGTTQLIVNGKIIGATGSVEIVDDHTANINSEEAVSILFK